MRESATNELLDDLQHHTRADEFASQTVLAAIRDRTITDQELAEIEHALRAVRTSRALVRVRWERLRSTILDVRGLLHCGEWTPVLERKRRERERDLAVLAQELEAA